MTEIAKEAIKKFQGSVCIDCGKTATLICCWKNIEKYEKLRREKESGKEIPYDYFPFCDSCSMILYKKLQPSLNMGGGLWINHRILIV